MHTGIPESIFTVRKSYQEKLQDPRWHEFRGEVLEFYRYTCRRCRRYESQIPLEVHHPFYRRGAEPWDYDVTEVELLCVDCHRRRHGFEPGPDDVPF